MATGVIVVFLSVIEYVNFVKIKQEIAYLQTTDTIRTKCLQLRRHEKNYFLYGSSGAAGDSRLVYKYLNDLTAQRLPQSNERLSSLMGLLKQYEALFGDIEASVNNLKKQIRLARMDDRLTSFIDSTFMDVPLKACEFLEKTAALSPDDPLITGLKTLDANINTLRSIGEAAVTAANDMDKAARATVDSAVRTSQMAILVLLPLFFIAGLGTLFIIGNKLANRLKRLVKIVENAGKGFFPENSQPMPAYEADELCILFQKFYEMERQISKREKELEIKNEELLQSRKLAAIGTLASGVAHELNNPLNNIYLCAQVLLRETADTSSALVKKITEDVLGQTKRAKRIIADLLEFARGRALTPVIVDVHSLVNKAFKQIANVADIKQVEFKVEGDNANLFVDSEELERVFINLFLNAIEAMDGRGKLSVRAEQVDGLLKISVCDTGPGIDAADIEKIFEPFFTTKDKGTGLGLAIVYNIISKHNGNLKVERQQGILTTFIITLPPSGHTIET